MSGTAPWRVVSAAPPGVFDGIGDFSASLTTALQAFGPTELFVRRQRWTEINDVDAANTAGAVVQYLPQAFMKGDLRALFGWLEQLRAAGKPVVLTVHEYWPPQNGTLRRSVRRLWFRRILRACLRRSSAIVTSQEWSAHELAHLAHGRPLVAIPVGSSIPPTGRAEANGSDGRLVLFGQPAALHRPTMAALGAWLKTAPPAVSLTWLGRSSEEMRAMWCDSLNLAADRVTFAGGLPAAEVSEVLQSARIGLAPYENGASTRRTSFAAMLEHRLSVVAVDGLYTSDWLRVSGACAWTAEGDPRAFVDALSGLLADPGRQAQLSASAGDIFEARMSWPRIAEGYARLLSGASV